MAIAFIFRCNLCGIFWAEKNKTKLRCVGDGDIEGKKNQKNVKTFYFRCLRFDQNLVIIGAKNGAIALSNPRT